jgi:hypothetical protein
MKCLSAWLMAALLLSGCGEPRGYVVLVEITGPQEAFSGRTLEVEGVTAPAAVAKTGASGTWTTEVALCTRSREDFLSRPVRVRVLEGDRLMDDRQVERVACRLSATPAGDLEHDILYLEVDGTLITDFGNDARVSATCDPPNHPLQCPQTHF